MALNPEPADPVDRQAYHLPPKSYADAAEEGLDGHPRRSIDDLEDAIKESPPHRHSRQGSEPRALAEVLTESEEHLPLPATPSRIPRKPLPDKSYADAVTEDTSGAVPSTPKDRYESEIEHYSGEGLAESSPRTSARKAHKRHSSKSMNGGPKQINDGLQSKLVYEKFENGDHLTSVKPPDEYEAGLRQDKIEMPQEAPSKDELTSGRQAGAGWQNSASVKD